MPSIVFTTTKSDANTPWITKSNTDFTYISQSEYEANVAPYWTFVESLPGYQSRNGVTNDTVSTITITFDTTNNVNNALAQLLSGNNTVVTNRTAAYQNAMGNLGVTNNYSFTVSTI